MAKTLKQLRTKDEVLRDNVKFLHVKFATQRWHKRVALTNYLRRKNEVAIKRFRSKTLMECYKQWHLRVQICKTLCAKTVKFARRLQCLQMADGFSQIMHFSKSFKERDRERREHSV